METAIFSVPNIDTATPENAADKIKELHSEVIQVGEKHPFCDAHNPLHKDYVNYNTALFELRPTPVDEYAGLLEEAQAKPVALQAKRQAEAEREYKFLVEDGFTGNGVPANVTEPQARLIKMQYYNHLGSKEDKSNLVAMIEMDMRKYGAAPEVNRSFEDARNMEFSEEFRKEAFHAVIAHYADKVVPEKRVTKTDSYGKFRAKNEIPAEIYG